MNKKVLATALLCFSLLLPAFPVVSAVNSGESVEEEACKISDYPSDTTLSREELLGLPGYVTPREEPVILVDSMKKVKPPSDSTSTDWAEIPEGPYPIPVYTMIIVDDDAKSFLQRIYDDLYQNIVVTWSDVFNWAYNILEAGDDPFWSWYTIDYVACEYRAWDSPIGTLQELLKWGQLAFPKPAGIDVTFIFTGRGQPFFLGFGERPGDAFIVSAWAIDYLCPLVNVWQHEASHNYGIYDHSSLDFTVCIMSGWWVAVTRSWCGDCSSKISQNKYRFG